MTLVCLVLTSILGARPDAGATEASEIRVVFSGDVTLGYHAEELFNSHLDAGMSRDEALGWGFARVKAVTRGADVYVANLECPFTTADSKLPKNFNFRADPGMVAALESSGVDVVSLANNHMVDYGPVGLFDTLSVLDQANIKHFGAGRTLADARTPAMIELRGVKIALLGYFFLGDRNIEPKEVVATGDTAGVAGAVKLLPEMRAMVTADVRAARAAGALPIPFFHWGREGFSQPEPYQVDLAHAAIEAGAAAVIGSHPHVLQGVELYRGAPIVYSLGNFVFGGNWDPRDKRTALAELTLTAKGVKATRLWPATSDDGPARPIQPALAEGEAADAILRYLAAISAPLGQTIPQLKVFQPDAGAP